MRIKTRRTKAKFCIELNGGVNSLFVLMHSIPFHQCVCVFRSHICVCVEFPVDCIGLCSYLLLLLLFVSSHCFPFFLFCLFIRSVDVCTVYSNRMPVLAKVFIFGGHVCCPMQYHKHILHKKEKKLRMTMRSTVFNVWVHPKKIWKKTCKFFDKWKCIFVSTFSFHGTDRIA